MVRSHEQLAGLHIAFVDLKEVFHTADSETQWKIIDHFGSQERMLRIFVNVSAFTNAVIHNVLTVGCKQQIF